MKARVYYRRTNASGHGSQLESEPLELVVRDGALTFELPLNVVYALEEGLDCELNIRLDTGGLIAIGQEEG
jgi:hypothetical protein